MSEIRKLKSKTDKKYTVELEKNISVLHSMSATLKQAQLMNKRHTCRASSLFLIKFNCKMVLILRGFGHPPLSGKTSCFWENI